MLDRQRCGQELRSAAAGERAGGALSTAMSRCELQAPPPWPRKQSPPLVVTTYEPRGAIVTLSAGESRSHSN